MLSPHSSPATFPMTPLTQYSYKQALSCKFHAISSLNIPTDTHLILTSSVQLTKCRLENKWQTPKQINYMSTKLLACVHRAGAGNRSRAHTAIWPVWERTSLGGATVHPLNSHRYLRLTIDAEHMLWNSAELARYECFYAMRISDLFWFIGDPLSRFYFYCT